MSSVPCNSHSRVARSVVGSAITCCVRRATRCGGELESTRLAVLRLMGVTLMPLLSAIAREPGRSRSRRTLCWTVHRTDDVDGEGSWFHS